MYGRLRDISLPEESRVTIARNDMATRFAIRDRIREGHASGERPEWTIVYGFDPKEADEASRIGEIADAIARGLVDGPDWILTIIGPDGERLGFTPGLDEARSESAEQIWLQYDFGTDGVGESQGWERTIPGEEWTRRVYLESDEQDVDEDSEAATLTIRFAQGSTLIEEAYAIDANGNIFGSIDLVRLTA